MRSDRGDKSPGYISTVPDGTFKTAFQARGAQAVDFKL
jgi:hypothetical protein